MPNMPDAIILCGGAGLRLRSVTGNNPKSMAAVSGRPFLEVLFKQLRRYGFQRVILAVGYQGEIIRSHFGERAFDLQLLYSDELSPLGTGGALRNAADLLESGSALVMNGDSYTDADLRWFACAHDEADADVSVLAVPVDGRGDCGSLVVENSGNVRQFEEKTASHLARHLNAGIYMMSHRMLYDIPAGVQISLERELFPRWIGEGRRVKAFVYSGKCVDIGTPERYETAQQLLACVEAGIER
jgi:NDP-sugar pyrophosphorylase family protein